MLNPPERVAVDVRNFGDCKTNATFTRSLKKSLSGLLQRRPSFSTLSSLSVGPPTKSSPSFPRIFANIPCGTTLEKGERLKDDEASLLTAKTGNGVKQLHQNSVTTHDLSEEGSSSSIIGE
jgi:hypothetical protein